jgi:hypothetical protein
MTTQQTQESDILTQKEIKFQEQKKYLVYLFKNQDDDRFAWLTTEKPEDSIKHFKKFYSFPESKFYLCEINDESVIQKRVLTKQEFYKYAVNKLEYDTFNKEVIYYSIE